MAGVIPALRAGGEMEAVYLREWSGDPVLGLKQAVADHFTGSGRLGEDYRHNSRTWRSE